MYTSDLGDHIGMESCVDLETDDIEPYLTCSSKVAAMNRKPCETSNRKASCARKELPPPLPIQASTVMKRYYTNDKRLVIMEEKVESPNKFRFMARRSHGRLTLQLVNNNNNNNNINEVSSDDDHENVVGDDVAGGGGGGCYKYNAAVRDVATGPCLIVN